MKHIKFWSLVWISYCISTATIAEDARQLVKLPEPLREHMMKNMQEHLLAISDIQQALAKKEFDKASEIAEKHVGMSSLSGHHASHLSAHMPKAMQEIGMNMHHAASQFALLAQECA